MEHVERDVEPPAPQGVVDPGPVQVELGDVAGEKHAVTGVEDVEVAVEDAPPEVVVELHSAIVVAVHELDDGPGRAGVRGGGTQLLRPIRGSLPGSGRRDREGDGGERGGRQEAARRCKRPRARRAERPPGAASSTVGTNGG